MFALYKLQAKVWVTNFWNKIDFVMTVFFLAVLGSFAIMQFDQLAGNEQVISIINIKVISSITMIMIASSAINTFGISFFEMRESVLLKRIGATEITKFKAVGAFVLWGMTSMVFILAWMYFWIGICQIPAIAKLTHGMLYVAPEYWQNMNVGGIFTSIIITMLAFYAISFFFISIVKTSTSFQIIGTFYYFLITFLGGQYTPNSDVQWMEIISYMSPLGWGTNLLGDSMLGLDVFNFNGYVSWSVNGPSMIESWEVICQITLPIVFGVLATLAAGKFFKWD